VRPDLARAHVRISGRVQGVFFRAEAANRARSLSLAGWIRNNQDGTVEAVFEGPRERVESMVRWSGRGPSSAVVQRVGTEWEEPAGEQGFTVY
jgi:acylphosphatase